MNTHRRLYRCRNDRKVAGVASGVAEFFELDPSVVRVVWLLSIFFGGLGLFLYIAMALIVPLEPLSDAAGVDARRNHGRGSGARAPSRCTSRGPLVPVRRGRARDVRRGCPARVGESGLGRLAVLRSRTGDRYRRPPRQRRGPSRVNPVLIGSAVLAIGLLLVLAGLLSARIPGRASFARPGIDAAPETGTDPVGGVAALARRTANPIRAFLLAPIHPATWYANGAVLLGLFTGATGFALVAALISTGLTTLLAVIGVAFLAGGIEVSRAFARLERWRTFAGEAVRPLPHPYKPVRGKLLDGIRAEFLDEARWRDVLYVGINLPLSVIEFVVVTVVWTLSIVFAARSSGTTPFPQEPWSTGWARWRRTKPASWP